MSKLSVVTVCLNAEGDIENTMRSVLEQTWQDLEYIIIDGASSDGTLNVIRSTASKYPHRNIHIKSEPDAGIYNAMNKGIAQATGEWINFMNAGDTFVSSTTIEQLFAYSIAEDVAVIFGDDYLICPFGKYLNLRKDIISFNQGCPFCHQAAFTRVEIIKKYGFDENFLLAGDYNLFLTIYKAKHIFEHKRIPIVNYKFGGISFQNMRKQIDEEELSFGRFGSISYYFRKLLWTLKEGIKLCLPKQIKVWHLKKILGKKGILTADTDSLQ